MLLKWRQDMDSLLGSWTHEATTALSRWKYAPTGDPSNPDNEGIVARVKAWLTSKVFWRIMLVIAMLLLLANLFTPTREVLNRYGWTPFASPKAEVLDPSKVPAPSTTDWSQFAYCQYVTNAEYLCNSLMIFESLVRVKAKAERLMMFPHTWIVGDNTHQGKLLAKARDEYHVRLVPIEVQSFAGEKTWAESFTKLLAFNQTRYKRVLSLDSDATVMKPMDELFMLPETPVAMPRAYWLEKGTLSSQLVLIEPSETEFKRIQDAFNSRSDEDFDMEIVNNLYGDSCAILPHRKYDLLTGEFRGDDHAKYLGKKEEVWDPEKVLDEAKFVHFSDWPLPKPWISASRGQVEDQQPKCSTFEDGTEDCRNRDKWLWLYQDFRDRRETVCHVE